MDSEWMKRLKEDGAAGFQGAFKDSSKSPQAQQHGHYRRKKTNKAPRKRTFIANMTKYNDGIICSLESAARGVGSAAPGGAGAGSATHGGPQNFFGPPGGAADVAGGAVDPFGSFPSFPADLTAELTSLASGDGASLLPWDLAALPTLAAPVVPGTKAAPALDAQHSQTQQQPWQQQQPAAAVNSFSFTNLLEGSDVEAQLAQWFPAAPKADQSAVASDNTQQQLQLAQEAAEVAAALVASVAAAPAPLPTPTGPPKVSFDLFPELAALASGTPLVAAPTACYSRAVVTVVEERGGAGFAPQALPTLSAAAASPTPVTMAHSVVSAGSVPAHINSVHGSGSAGHLSLGSTQSGQTGVAGVGVGSFGATSPAAPAHHHHHHHQLSASVAAAVAQMQAATSSAASGPAMSAVTSSVSHFTRPALVLPQSAFPAAAAAGGRGAPAGRRGGAASTARGSTGRGRGTKRGGANVASASGVSSPTLSAATATTAAPWAANTSGSPVMGAPAAGSAGSGNSTGAGGVRPPPFTLPLHGMSAAGAVVPGSAGELAVSRLVNVGAYGAVYRARWVGGHHGGSSGACNGGEVAVKVMRRPQPGEGLSEGDVLASFRHEASLLSRLAHPNIVALRHAQDVEPVCMVQDLAAHGTLSEYIHQASPAAGAHTNAALMMGMGPVSLSDLERAVLRRLARRVGVAPDGLVADLEARSVAGGWRPAQAAPDGSLPHVNQRSVRRYVVLLCLLRDVAAAMTYLAGPLPAAQGGCVVHRDVKPSNILLSAAGTALLADFGVAKAMPMPTLTPTAAAASAALAPAASAPPPSLTTASSAEVAAVYAEWGSEGAHAAKRARSASAGDVSAAAAAPAAHAPMGDILPSSEFDMYWLDELFGEEAGAPAVAPAAAAAGAAHLSSHGSRTNLAASAGAATPKMESSWPVHHGTAHYAAPEDLARGRSPYPLTPAADVFSLGTVIWEALTGRRPWLGVRASDVADAVGVQGARLPLPGCWPARLRAIVARCWAADPAQRPTAREVASVLDEEVRCALHPGGSL